MSFLGSPLATTKVTFDAQSQRLWLRKGCPGWMAMVILMEIVWEAYHNLVPLLGVPENPIDRMVVLDVAIYLMLA